MTTFRAPRTPTAAILPAWNASKSTATDAISESTEAPTRKPATTPRLAKGGPADARATASNPSQTLHGGFAAGPTSTSPAPPGASPTSPTGTNNTPPATASACSHNGYSANPTEDLSPRDQIKWQRH